jgi:hypothetical protein
MDETEASIMNKCSIDAEPADFTAEEKEYITLNQSSLEWLFYWFESNQSDGCWTEQNYEFMRRFYSATSRVYRVCDAVNNV